MCVTHHGILLTMRNDVAIDKERYKMYRDEVLISFVSQKSIEFGDWKKGTRIPGNIKEFSWCDGDLAQVNNTTSEESLNIYSENMIRDNKQSVAR